MDVVTEPTSTATRIFASLRSSEGISKVPSNAVKWPDFDWRAVAPGRKPAGRWSAREAGTVARTTSTANAVRIVLLRVGSDVLH